MQSCKNAVFCRSGKINMLWLVLLVGAASMSLLLGLLYLGGVRRDDDVNVIKVHCATGLHPAMEKIAAMYKDEYGVEIQFNAQGSQTLLAHMEINKFDDFDLYLAADDLYTGLAVEKGLAAEVLPIARQWPVLAVRKDSDLNIESLDDLLADGVRIVTGNPDEAAIGKAVKELLSNVASGDSNRWEQLEARIVDDGAFKDTVSNVAADLKVGSADVAIVWDSTVAMPKFRDVLRAISIPEFEDTSSLVSICVLNSTRNPTAALKFARYVSAANRGLPVFEEFGTQPIDEGDAWAERPQVNFFCGAVNRRAMEQILADFEAREGVEINTKYDGCGILTGQMKTFADQRTDLGFPDLYMACDVYYLENVKEWFQDVANVSDTEIVIVTQKGKDDVKSVGDLIKPGVRVAVGEPAQCTIGALTRRLLVKEGLYDALKKKQLDDNETVVEKPSSALLVPDVVSTHADAAVVYITDAQPNLDRVDVIHIDSPLNVAVQPISISKTSQHKQLLRRLLRRVAESPEAFESVGFNFRLNNEDGGNE